MKNIDIQGLSSTERLLHMLPKKCTCHICEASKREAKKELGAKKFKKLCRDLQIHL